VYFDDAHNNFKLAFKNVCKFHFDDKAEALDVAQQFHTWNQMTVIKAECSITGVCLQSVFDREYVEKYKVEP
jgi:hypothetical protein